MDYDPIVLAHARALMASHDDGLIDYLDADLRDTQPTLDQASRILDFSQPVAVMLIAIMHAIGDRDDPYGIVARLISAVPAGSYLILSHGAADIDAEQMAEVARRITGPVVSSSPPRSHTQVTRFFDGLDLLDPGVVPGSRSGGQPPGRRARAPRPYGAAWPSGARRSRQALNPGRLALKPGRPALPVLKARPASDQLTGWAADRPSWSAPRNRRA